MKKLIGMLLMMSLMLTPVMAGTNFRPVIKPASLLPFGIVAIPGDNLEMTGRICVDEGDADFSGTLKYQIYGPATEDPSTSYKDRCRVACYNCYDYEICGGRYCPPNPNIIIPGQDCGVAKKSTESSIINVPAGTCSDPIVMTLDTNNLDPGYYLATLCTVDSQQRTLDLEWEYFDIKVGKVDVQILQFIATIGSGLSILSVISGLVLLL